MTQQQGGNIDRLITQALVRKLVAKGYFSPSDVHSLLLDAIGRLDSFGGSLSAGVARNIVDHQLMPAFAAEPSAPFLEPRIADPPINCSAERHDLS